MNDPWKEFRDLAFQGLPQPDQIESERQEVFTLSGKTAPYYLDVGVDDQSNLLGNRWLTREGSLFIVAPSGHGKSSLTFQAMINWAIGRVAFGIKPTRPLKILFLESEDDDADLKSFAQVLRKMKLSQADMDLLDANTRVEFRRDLCGERFFSAIDQFLDQFPADIMIVNPLTGFCSVQLSDEEKMSNFLRVRLNQIMVKHHCAPVIVAHMPKHQVAEISLKEWYEWMYVLSGCATLTNWARAILVFVPCPKLRGTYKFITAKRPMQSGWTEPEYYFAHSKSNLELNGETFEVIEWLPATQAQIAQAEPEKKLKRIRLSIKDIHAKLSPLDDLDRDQFRGWMKETFNVGRPTADDLRAMMVKEGLLEEILGPCVGTRQTKTWRKIVLTK